MAGGGGGAGGDENAVVLAVWAHVDDDVPVAGATVRVYATARPPASWRGQPAATLRVSPSSIAGTERTYRTGVALLEFSRLPTAFTVEVTGGQARGRPLPGSFSVVVRNYVSGAVVDVDPVTTLITDDLAGLRRLPVPAATARARAQVYRLLDIPGWQDQVDLRSSTRYFDGATYLEAGRRAGGIGRLDWWLVRQARRGEQHRFLSPAPTFTGGPRLSGPVASAAVLPLTGGALIAQAFKFLAVQAGSSLAQVAGQQAGTAALGWLLAAFGFQDALKDQDVVEIRRIVEALSKQVTELKGDVALAGFSNLLHLTDRTIGQIAYANGQLELLAKLPANAPNKAEFARMIVDYIGANLTAAPEILNQSLGVHVRLADNVFTSASRTLGQRRFFGPKSSAEVRSVYEYFAAYQVQLAMLLQEYYHAKPTVYNADTNAYNLAQLHKNVESQAGSLKPDVPANTVIDTKSREMWVTDLPGSEKRLSDIADVDRSKFFWRGRYVSECGGRPIDGPTGLDGFPYCDWEMPSLEAYKRLVDGWSGRSPAYWLGKEAGFSQRLLSPTNHGYDKWIKRDYRIGGEGSERLLFIDTFNLQFDQVFKNKLSWGLFTSWQSRFERLHAGLMYVRKLAPGESYWWSS